MRNGNVFPQAFQSLVGFKINWNFQQASQVASANQPFQSLVGFKINWNKREWSVTSARSVFQSLVGFKINWNMIMIFNIPD